MTRVMDDLSNLFQDHMKSHFHRTSSLNHLNQFQPNFTWNIHRFRGNEILKRVCSFGYEAFWTRLSKYMQLIFKVDLFTKGQVCLIIHQNGKNYCLQVKFLKIIDQNSGSLSLPRLVSDIWLLFQGYQEFTFSDDRST